MSLQLQPYIPVSLPTQIQAGRELIQTDMPMAVARNAREGQFTAVYVYDSIFSNNKAGLGQAAAVILTIILVVLTQIVTRSLRRLEVEQ